MSTRKSCPEAPIVLKVHRLVKHFSVTSGGLGRRKTGLVRAVDDVSFELRAGETLALVGESGCGKSTTGRIILGLLNPTSGDVKFSGQDVFNLKGKALRALRREMHIIFQDPYGSLNPRLTVADIIAEPIEVHRVAVGEDKRKRVASLLQAVGLLPSHLNRYPHEFSGGQRQRIGIARALALQPKLIVCDEPVSALDVSVQAQVVNLLQDLQKQFGLAYLFIAHDLAVVKHVSDRIAVMYLGKFVEFSPKAELFQSPRHPYTQALMSANPMPDPRLKRERIILEGDVPSPLNPPSGCRFHTRCAFAREECAQTEPELQDTGNGHFVACHFWREIGVPRAVRDIVARAPEERFRERLEMYESWHASKADL
jgi:oligopeptide/dipeptide ABC transporter ATP-binding protein